MTGSPGRRKRKGRAGFSLLELMVAAGIFTLVVTAFLQSFVTQQQAYTIVDQVSEVQQNLHAVAARMEHDLRVAGYMVPPETAVCGWDAQAGPDTLFVSNASAIRPADQLIAIDPDLGESRFGAPVNGIAAGGTVSTPLSLAQSFLDLAADGADFAQNEGVIVFDRNDDTGSVACGIVTNANPGTTLQVDFGGTSLTASASPDVVAVPAHVYRIFTPGGGGPQLLRDGLVFASDVEDLQVAYFLDGDGDQLVDPNEYVGDGSGPDYDPSAMDNSDLREVRVNLVFRTRDPDPRTEYQQGRGEATENRNPATVPGADGLRRRVHTATVRSRNLGRG